MPAWRTASCRAVRIPGWQRSSRPSNYHSNLRPTPSRAERPGQSHELNDSHLIRFQHPIECGVRVPPGAVNTSMGPTFAINGEKLPLYPIVDALQFALIENLSLRAIALAERQPSCSAHRRRWRCTGRIQSVVATSRYGRCCMGRSRGWGAEQTGRAPMRSPGRPGVNQRDAKRAFWKRITEGLSSEDAALACGVSQPVGPRWFREAGGMAPSNLAPHTGRYLSFAEREELPELQGKGHGTWA
ncbi:hypothetical protein SAMN04488129_12019 [Halomonas daqiaonensis]|uniref:Helix-turn-helix domain-containing protein n=1 Tax=Halomonas daqiaonensis TaxID=650850 RepID=A0A1H7UCW3_9GAMM|nr:hypothetical protein SAMN04488129_12019 [Halomonas daqiaonensis]